VDESNPSAMRQDTERNSFGEEGRISTVVGSKTGEDETTP